jgi:hypothetical protein
MKEQSMGRSIQQNIEHQKKRGYWQGHLECWQSSGKTATDYCREQGLSIDNFKYWQYQMLPETRGTRGRKEFVEVGITEHTQHAVIKTTMEGAPILVETPSGYKIHLPRDLSQAELSILFSCLRQTV